MLVGEAPGREEAIQGRPFVGASGQLLRKLCAEAGLNFDATWRTNVARYNPPGNNIDTWFYNKTTARKKGVEVLHGRYPNDVIRSGLEELSKEIELVKPQLIIALGATALWGLTGRTGISSWRGSQIETFEGLKCIPTYHPAAILRQWSMRPTVLTDLTRAREWLEGRRQPRAPRHIVAPTYVEAKVWLNTLLSALHLPNGDPRLVSVDIETRGGFMACVGLAISRDDAMCIPFTSTSSPEGVYTLEEERTLRKLLKQVLLVARCIMQNGIYDCQYFIREDGYCPNVEHDTMLLQHAMYPGTPKGLDYLASLYCEHYQYWKAESKEWDPKLGERQLWLYNCKDACATFEVFTNQFELLQQVNLKPVYWHLMALYKPVLQMMTKGVRLDEGFRGRRRIELENTMSQTRTGLAAMLGHDLNPRSPAQLKTLFYEDFGVDPTYHPKTKKPTLDEAALEDIKRKRPEFGVLVDRILRYRQAGVLLSTFINFRNSPDGRYHTSYNIGGTETFRFSSQANGFGEGTNSQNIPPHERHLMLPDPGYEIQDHDLATADAQVVAWDADDAELKDHFRAGRNIHVENCRALFPQVKGWSDEAVKASQVADNHYARYYFLSKTGVHATNYYVQDRTLARTLGITVREAAAFRAKWLGMHPAIAAWQDTTFTELKVTSQVHNAFGFRRVYFDRIDVKTLQEALAWIGQSTVAVAIAKGMLKIYCAIPEVDLLFQVHDSVVIQVPLDAREVLTPKVKSALAVAIPYPDPLVIPTSMKRSSLSWGDCS